MTNRIFRFCGLLVFLFLEIGRSVMADTPLGWISSDNPSAYTLPARGFELSLSGALINDTLDVLDIRDELIADTDNLAGDTGDLAGQTLAVHYGLTSFLTLFASTGSQDLTVEFGDISSATITDADSELRTDYASYGVRWLIYEAISPFNARVSTSLALEFTRFESDSADFDVSVSELTLPNLSVFFADPQTFSVNDLEDEGWSAKLLYSTPWTSSLYASAWAGLGSADAESGTTSTLAGSTIGDLFEQDFSLEEDYLYFGLGLDWFPRPRMPVSIKYEMLRIQDSDFISIPAIPSETLPGFLRASNSNEDMNHTLSARLSWWVDPRVNISFYGKLFSNQFLGRLPHYNNPLSGSFADKEYGYVGIEFGIKI